MQPIDIFSLVDKAEMERKTKFNHLCGHIKTLADSGMEKEAIGETIKALNLPLDMHMAIFGRFSEICKHGRPLTKTERKIFG